jgi:hypothetical protein
LWRCEERWRVARLSEATRGGLACRAGERVTFHVQSRDTFGGAMRVGGLQLELQLETELGAEAHDAANGHRAAQCFAVEDLHDGTYRCR